MDKLDPKNDENEEPLAVVLDAGALAMLAALVGDKEEERKQLERGRKAYRKIRDAQILAQLKEFDDRCRSREQDHGSRPRREKKSKTRQATTNLGDLLKGAGVTVAEKAEETPGRLDSPEDDH